MSAASLSGGQKPFCAASASARLHRTLSGAGRSLLLSADANGSYSDQLRAHALDYATNALRRAEPEFSAAQVEPDQLLKAVCTFDRSPDDVACLQARLNFFNARECWISSGIMAQTPLEALAA